MLKTRRFGIDVKPELETLMRAVNVELGLVYKSQLTDEAFRRAESRLKKLIQAAGADSEKQSVVQGGLNQLAHARSLADLREAGVHSQGRLR